MDLKNDTDVNGNGILKDQKRILILYIKISKNFDNWEINRNYNDFILQ